MTILVGLIITLACMFGGFAAMGGKIYVIWQPWEYVIILGASLGTFVVANPLKTIKDSGCAIAEAIIDKKPTEKELLELLSVLHQLLRGSKTRSRADAEAIFDTPMDSAEFKAAPLILSNSSLTLFICDYMRLILIGTARSHEIEALMDEELDTIRHDLLKSYHALVTVGDGLPALGIVAAVLGVVKAMGAIDQSPEILGGLIAAALVGTFAGIFFSYAVVAPIAAKIKDIREKRIRLYIIVKQTLLAHMNGAMPQIAIEYGRKTIPGYERPSIEAVESATISPGAPAKVVAQA